MKVVIKVKLVIIMTETKSIKKLEEARIKAHYTYADMATMVGISKAYYWQIENGTRRLYYHLAVKIAKIFNMKPDDLFYDNK